MTSRRAPRRELRDAYRFPGFTPQSDGRRPLRRSRARGSWPSVGAQKNGLRGVWAHAPHVVRPQDTPGARPALRRSADLSRRRGTARRLPPVRRREARTARLARGQSALHPALCALRGQAVPQCLDQGGGGRFAPRLARGQGDGQALHAGASGPGRRAATGRDRDRRNLDSQRARLSHHRQRFGARACRSGSAGSTGRKTA